MFKIPEEALPHYENAIYLPMLAKILEKDRRTIEVSQFKLKRPYIKIVEESLKLIHSDLKQSNIYLKRNNMKLMKVESDKDFTEYVFAYGGYEEHRNYSNVRLRNRSEELMSEYFSKVDLI